MSHMRSMACLPVHTRASFRRCSKERECINVCCAGSCLRCNEMLRMYLLQNMFLAIGLEAGQGSESDNLCS